MRLFILGGAVAAAMWGQAALAADWSTREPEKSEQEVRTNEGTKQEVNIIMPEQRTTPEPKQEAAKATTPQKARTARDEKLTGPMIMLGGGVEGYSGELADQLRLGPGWGVTAALRPLKAMTLEAGYSGAVNEVNAHTGVAGGVVSGADLVRNGGHLATTVGLPTPIQPYVLAGIGFSRYDFRGIQGVDFQDDTIGNIPLGGGVRYQMGNFAADARFDYNVQFDQEFAVNTTSSTSGGRYQGLLQLGAKF